MNKYLIIFAVCIFSIGASAQGIKFGPKLGANMGKIDGKGFNQSYTLGYHLGGFVELQLNKKWGIQPEVLWNQISADTVSGFKAIYQNISSQSNFNNLKLNYLSVPVLLNYKPSKLITLQAGPQFGILLDKNKNLLQNGQEAFKKGDLSMLAGIQLNILKLRLYGRYVIGLNNISDVGNSEKWRNQGIQLGVGISL
ncbi:MAG: PorT family protein [Chitinophagaceae bacterium]|nr:PorT family protein [Chitinophagaceae bacterium]